MLKSRESYDFTARARNTQLRIRKQNKGGGSRITSFVSQEFFHEWVTTVKIATNLKAYSQTTLPIHK